MQAKDMNKLKVGTKVILKDKSLYDGDEFIVLEDLGWGKYRIQHTKRPVIIRTATYLELESEEK